VHECPECGKRLATAGGLDLHIEMAHAPTPVAAEAVELVAPAAPMTAVRAPARERRRTAPAPVKLVRPDADAAPQGDAALPLAWVLVILLLIGSVAAALVNPDALGATMTLG
jgi:hypothetical protein